jgi:hypothetical protein
MSEEIQVAADGSVDFDFGFDKFKAMGFQFEGRLIQCRIEQPKEAEYSFVDKRNGQTVTKKAKPQLPDEVREPHPGIPTADAQCPVQAGHLHRAPSEPGRDPGQRSDSD